MKLHIRELTARDLSLGFLEALASLSEVELTPEDAIPIFRNRLRVGVHTYVALLDDRIVGTASLFIEPKFIHHGGKVGHIEDVAVHRDFQRRGIGTALVEYANAEARKAGCYKVILYCFEHLVPFYTRLGFRPYNSGLRLDL